MKPPFKIRGIYARKLDPKKEIINHNQTKLGSIWKIATGEKEESFYEIIAFSTMHSFSEAESITNRFCANYNCMYGEIFNLVDGHKCRASSSYKFKNVIYDEKTFEFSNENTKFSGQFYEEDILQLSMINLKTAENIIENLRYIPWI